MWDLIIITSLCVFFYWFLIYPYEYWKKRGVPGPKPSTLLGNLGQSVTLKKNLGQIYRDIYNNPNYKDLLYVGYYKFRKPGVLIRDPELIKNVLLKDFSSFHDNDLHIDTNVDPYFGNNPFCLPGQKWKEVRSLITSAITTSKIKNMFSLMNNVSKDLVNYVAKEIKSQSKDGFEAKELAQKFTTDVVASCAFGLDAGCFTDATSDFRIMGKKFLEPSFWMGIRHMLIFVLPSMANFLRVKFMSQEVEDWFVTVVTETVKYRETSNVSRPDYLDMLIGLRNKTDGNFKFTEKDIVAQAVTFYTDGFETSAITLSHALYELSKNPDQQDKLRKEIETVLAKHKGEVTYDSVQEMNYLDMVLSETLRLHSPLLFIARQCTKKFELPPPRGVGKGPPVTIEPGTPVIIPSLAVHYDPQNFPDPYKFDPERFNEQNKNSVKKGTFLAFGEGPRICFGSKFGLAQTKAALIGIVRNFDLKLNKKTNSPLKLDPQYVFNSPIGGLWINFSKRAN